ncbi:Ig-like domain-containing protein [Salegentibacter agarivorans]|uniref:Ig-like domain-containing protein n=1 Tax=Salegentibacter agarivorans TaxID=345907 RepID=A0A1I2Q1U2_9FLAO|nr:MBG domain-containing protein [Salegentibacter agarivorans]SFG22248.1 Ig-like domain-containing protein [Salegentibacter agarivorans]
MKKSYFQSENMNFNSILIVKLFTMIVLLLPFEFFGQAFTETFDTNPCGSNLCTTTNFTRNLNGVDFEFTFQGSGDGGNFSYETEYGEGNSPAINLLSGALNPGTTETVTIKRRDNGEFIFNSIFVNNTDAQTLTFQGYKNGSAVSSSQSAPRGTNNTLNFSGITLDEVRITSTDFYNINLDSFSGEIPSSVTVPTVNTSSVSSITATGATFSGNVTDDGGTTVTARGFVYSSLDNTPTIGESGVTKISNGSGTGTFEESVSGLSGSTNYYYQAYATNSEGTIYGGVESFITSAVNNPPTDIKLPLYNVSRNQSPFAKLTTTDADPTDTFTYTLIAGEGDDNNSSYEIVKSGVDSYVRFKVSGEFIPEGLNSIRIQTNDGIDTFEKIFSFNVAYSFENFSWTSSSNVANTTGVTYTFNYEIVTPNPTNILYVINYDGWEVPFLGESSNNNKITDAEKQNVTVKVNGVDQDFSIRNWNTGLMEVSLTDSNITAGAQVQIIVDNVTNKGAGSHSWRLIRTSYPSGQPIDEAFGPNPIVLLSSTTPVVSTISATEVNSSQAILNGNITSDGGATVTERGFVYSSSDNTPTIGGSGVTQISNGSGTGTFEESVSGLSGSTNYYYQAYATNTEGTSYGGVESFATLTSQNPPSITSTPAKTIPYGQQYNYGVVASVEGNLETILSAPTLPAWSSFSTDGVGTAAQFGDIPSGVYLSGVAGDEEGNIYAIRQNGTEIFKIEPDGTTTSWKSGMIPGSVYALHIANGYVYIPRYYNSTQSITRVPLNDPSATEEVFIARSGGVLSLTDKDGFIYAANYSNSEILKINESTKAVEVVLTDADGIPTYGPFGLTFDDEDNLYIATWGNNTILKYDGTSVSTVLSNLPRNVSSIRVDASGNFYLSMSNGGVRKYTSDFSSFEVVSLSETDNIWSLSFTSSGSLVYAKYSTNEVYRLQTGAVLTGTPTKSDVGDHPVVLRAENETGFIEQAFTITVIDETAPALTTLSPANNATDVTLQPSLKITFDEEIALGTSGTLTVNNGSTVLRTFDLSETVDLDLIEVAEDNLSVSIPLDIALPVNTKISIGLSGGFVQDQAENDFDGFTRDSNTWTFTTINKLDQNITFPEISTKAYGDDEFILGDEVTDQGLVVTYTAQDTDIISISGNKATILKVGTTQITATQEGDEETFSAEPVTQTLSVNKAAITIAADNKSKIYGGPDPELTYEIAAGDLVGDDTISGELIRENGENAGSYTIQQGTLNLSSNYDLTYKTADLTIEKAEAVITADDTQTFTYDGAEKEVTAELNHTEAELSYTPQQGYTDAGTYPVTVSVGETDNYLATSKEVSLVIDNAETTGVTLESETYTYDGASKTLTVTGLPEGASVSYNNNDKINAGTYTVTATVSQKNYNDKILTADLVIEKAEALITADDTQTFTYDGAEKEVTAELNHTEAELTYTPQQGYTKAGTYPVTVSVDETDNYLATSKEVSLVVDNAEITGVAFENETFTYNDEVHNLAVTGLPEGASVSYNNNDKINAGTYKVTATVIQENYNNKILTADLVINKAEAIITAEATQTFTYDGTVKNVEANLNHSETQLAYAPQQGYTNAGTYPVTISSEETDNYLSASKEVSLVIENAEIEGVAFEGDTFIYDGTKKSIAVIGLPEGATVTYANNGQINAGTYKVTATVRLENYNDKILTADLVIKKAEAVIIADAIQMFTYGGIVKDVSATLNHSETQLTYTPQQGYINAGTYPVTISSEETDNYLSASKEVSLVIDNAEIEGVTFEGETYVSFP